MQLRIARWGNSLALRLPSHVVREANLTEGAAVQIETRGGEIVVTPVRKKFKLSELLAKMPAKDRAGEYDWGKPQGDEEW
jgi:antitoxin MazE